MALITKITESFLVNCVMDNLINDLYLKMDSEHVKFQYLLDMLNIVDINIAKKYFLKKEKILNRTLLGRIILFVLDCAISMIEKKPIDNKIKKYFLGYECNMEVLYRNLNYALHYLEKNSYSINDLMYYLTMNRYYSQRKKDNYLNNDKVILLVKNFSTPIHAGAHYNLFEAFYKSVEASWGKENINLLIVDQLQMSSNIQHKKHFLYQTLLENTDIPFNKVHYIPMKDLLNEESLNTIIEKYKGSVIVFGGSVVGERVLHPSFYKKGRKILYIKFNINNRTENVFADIVLTPHGIKNPKDNEVPFFYPMGSRMKNDTLKQRDTKRLNLDGYLYTNTCNMISVLSNNRLLASLKSLSEQELNLLKSILDSNDILWHLVGIQNSNDIYEFIGIEYKDKIKIYDYIEDLISMYNKMDIFFNIPRSSGGGTGMLIAALSSLPVVSLKNSDISGYIDTDLLFEDDKIFQYLELFICNHKERLLHAQKQMQFIEKSQDYLTIGNKLRNILDNSGNIN